MQIIDTIITQLHLHKLLWLIYGPMSRESLPMININQFAEGSGLVTILEKK